MLQEACAHRRESVAPKHPRARESGVRSARAQAHAGCIDERCRRCLAGFAIRGRGGQVNRPVDSRRGSFSPSPVRFLESHPADFLQHLCPGHRAPPRCSSNRTTHVLLHRTDHLLLTVPRRSERAGCRERVPCRPESRRASSAGVRDGARLCHPVLPDTSANAAAPTTREERPCRSPVPRLKPAISAATSGGEAAGPWT